MLRSPPCVDSCHSEAVHSKRLELGDLKHRPIIRRLYDTVFINAVPATVLPSSNLDEIMGHRRVVKVERRRPGEVDGTRRETHDQWLSRRVWHTWIQIKIIIILVLASHLWVMYKCIILLAWNWQSFCDNQVLIVFSPISWEITIQPTLHITKSF